MQHAQQIKQTLLPFNSKKKFTTNKPTVFDTKTTLLTNVKVTTQITENDIELKNTTSGLVNYNKAVSAPISFLPLSLNPTKIVLQPKVKQLTGFKQKEILKNPIKFLNASCGLPSNAITTIAEDELNNIWLGFNSGIARLNTDYITIYNSAANLPDFTITKITSFNHKLYIGTFGGGLYELDGNTLKVYNSTNGFKTDLINDLEVYNNELWIATYGQGIYKLNNNEFSKIASSNLSGKEIVSSLASLNNQLYFTTNNKIGILKNNTLKIIDETCGLPKDEFSEIVIDKKNNIWVAAQTNFLIKIDSVKCTTFKELQKSNNSVNALYAAKSGKIWIAQANVGLINLGLNSYFKVSITEGLSDNKPTCFFQDSGYNLWVGTKSNGVNLLYPSNFSNISNVNPELNSVQAIYTDNNKLYFSNNSNQLTCLVDDKFQTIEHPSIGTITSIQKNKIDNSIWFSSNTGIFKYNNNQLFKIETVIPNDGYNNQLNVSFDNTNSAWISNYNFGVFKYENNQFKYYENWLNNGNSLVYNTVTDLKNRTWICADKGNISYVLNDTIFNFNFKNYTFLTVTDGGDGSVYIGTNNGLLKYFEGNFYKYELENIVKNERITTLYFDVNNSKLWFGTPQGICTLFKNKLVNFDENDGLISSAVNNKALTTDSLGVMYWGTSKGIVKYMPFEFKHQKQLKQLLISKVTLLNSKLNWNDLKTENNLLYDSIINGVPYGLLLPKDNCQIQFNFSCNNWGKEESINYFYKLNDEHTDWISLGNKHSITFNDLKSGEYSLYLKAIFPDGQVGYDLQYNFAIEKPFYSKPWFIVTMCLLLFASVWLMISKFSDFSFDNYEGFDELLLLKKKARILTVFGLILIPGINYLEGELQHQFIVNWPLCLAFIPMCVFTFIFTYFKKCNFRTLYLLQIVVYSYVCFFEIIKLSQNNLAYPLIIEDSILFLFCILIFRDIKSTFIFTLFIFLAVFLAIKFSTANPQNVSLLVSASIQIFITVFTIQYLERKKLEKVLFSDKILQNSEAFVIVFDNTGNVVYTNPYLQKAFGYQSNQFLGEGYWILKKLSPQQKDEVRLGIKNTIINNKPTNYNLEVTNSESKIIHLSCQDSVIEGKYLLSIGKDITTELQQKQELEQLSIVAKNVTNGVVITDKYSKIVWCNAGFENISEYTLAEIIGKRPIELFSGSETNTNLKTKITNEHFLNEVTEILQYTKSGKAKWFLINNTIINDADGNIEKQIEIITDITKQKTLEESYGYILKNAGDIIYTADVLGNFVYVNDSMIKILGYDKVDVINKHFTEIIAPEFKRKMVVYYKKQLINNIKSSYYEFQVITKQGLNKWVGQNVTLSYNDKNEPVGFQAIVRDIDDRKTLEDKYKHILENAADIIYTTDEVGKFNYVNEYMCKFFKCKADDLIGKPFTDVILPEDKRKVYAFYLNQKKQKTKNSYFEFRVIINNEDVAWLGQNVKLNITNDNSLMFQSLARNITDKKKSEVQLQQLSLVAEKTTNSIIITDKEENIVWVNKAFTDLTEYTYEEVVGKNTSQLLQGKETDKQAQDIIANAVAKKTSVQVELINYKKSGTPYWTRLYIDPVFDDQNNFTHFISVDYDITDIKLKEDKVKKYNTLLMKYSLKPYSSYASLNNAINEIIADTALSLDIERISVWEMDNKSLYCTNILDSVNQIKSRVITLQKNDFPIYFNAINKGIALLVNDINNNENTIEFVESYSKTFNIKSLLDVPIRYNGELAGVLCCETINDYKQWTIEDETFLRSVSDLIASYKEAEKLKKIEDAVFLSESNFRQLNETIDDVFWLYDLENYKIDYISPSSEKILGVTPQQFYDTNNFWENYIFEEDKHKIIEAHQLIETVGFYEVEYRIKDKDNVKWILEKSFGIKNIEGKIVKSSGICSDITDKKQRDLELENSRRQLKKHSTNLEFQNEIKSNLINATSINDITRYALNLIKNKYRNCLYVSLLNLDDKKTNLVGHYIKNEELVTEKYPLSDIKSYEYSKQGEIFIEADLISQPLKSKSDEQQIELGVKSYIVVPILYATELIATLNVFFSETYNLTAEEVNTLENLASILATTVKQITLQHLLVDKNKDITDSLRYAQNIQQSILPKNLNLNAPVKDLMIYYKPRDFVSGDFYWIEHINNYTVIAVGDCTGHGVPGSFLTLLGISLIQKIILENKITSPSILLKILDRAMFDMLNQNSVELVRDGMELSICFIDNTTKKITHAGAGQGLVMFRGDEQIIIKGTPSPIGDFKTDAVDFQENEINVIAGDKIYLFSDGYQDQLGGEKYKRLSKKIFFEILESIKQLPVNEQQQQLEHKINTHKRHFAQTDDITVLGFTIK